MAIEARKISWWDNARLLFLLGGPASLWGLVVANRLFVPLLCKLDTGQWAVRTLAGLRQKYRSDHLWAWFPFGSTLLVLSQESMERVLQSDKNQADPLLKKRPFSQFVPDALVISTGDEWKDRRQFNEKALDFGRLHRCADAFKEIAFREVDRLAAESPGHLRWNDFEKLGKRISHQVVLGSGQHDPEMARQLERMTRRSNWFILPRTRSSFSAFYREIERHLSLHHASNGSQSEQHAVGNPAPACLARESAGLLETGQTTSATQVPSQIGFWLFVLKDAVELQVPRTLAMIAAHPEVQRRVRREVMSGTPMAAQAVDGLQYLEACIREQLRLWTPVPILLRRAVETFALHDGISVKARQQILMHPGFYHRDPGVFGQFADRFSPDAVGDNSPPVYNFSGHRQSCAGQFVAMFMLKATLAAWLAKFQFELVAPRIDPNRLPHLFNHFKIELRAIRDP